MAAIETLCNRAAVTYFRFHALRHSGASIMDNSGVPLGAIQKILGHENRKTTEIYLHSFGEAEKAAISIMNAPDKNLTQLSHKMRANKKGAKMLLITI